MLLQGEEAQSGLYKHMQHQLLLQYDSLLVPCYAKLPQISGSGMVILSGRLLQHPPGQPVVHPSLTLHDFWVRWKYACASWLFG